MELETLQRLYSADPAARVLLDRWAIREKRTKTTNVASLLGTEQVKEAGLSRGDVIRVLKDLDSLGCGRFIAGRRGKESRFQWAEDSIQVGQMSKSAEARNIVLDDIRFDRPHSDKSGAKVVIGTNSAPSRSETSIPSGGTEKGHERIVVQYKDGADHGLPKSKAFFGKWIISPEEPLVCLDDDGEGSTNYCVAITAKKNFVIYRWDDAPDLPRYNERFLVYNSSDQAAADPEVNMAITEAISRMGVEVEELDI